MPVSARCPKCSAAFRVKDEYAGKRTKCPKCGGPMSIPAVNPLADTIKMPQPPPRPPKPDAD